jgi:2-polyprenyl-3-methyl-5-hydroxy-6-metoxy-1,4-benzoquinol methylase
MSVNNSGKWYFDLKKEKMNYDLTNIGTWQMDYAEWLDLVFGFKDKKVLDFGSSCGTLGWSIHKRGAEVFFCEPFSYLIADMGGRFNPLGIDKNYIAGAPEYVQSHAKLSLIEYCDFPEKSFHMVHSHMVLEHLNDTIAAQKALANVYRMLKPGGLSFNITTMNKGDDPTHTLLRPEEFWTKQAMRVGFDDIKLEYMPLMDIALKRVSHDFFKMYGVVGRKNDGFPKSDEHRDWMVLIWQKPQ